MIYYILLILLVIVPQIANADIINVPDDHETIQAAIRAADNGDTVLVEEGVYNESIDFLGRNIVVASRFLTTGDEEFITETIIDPEGEGRCVVFEHNETEDAQLIGFTLQNGASGYGAGIRCEGAAPRLLYLIISDNNAERNGGGIYCTSGAEPEISYSIISGNTVGDGGERGWGAGICCNRSNPVIFYSVIVDNSALRYGGAIYCTNESSPVMDHLTIYGNTAETGRGGIHFRE